MNEIFPVRWQRWAVRALLLFILTVFAPVTGFALGLDLWPAFGLLLLAYVAYEGWILPALWRWLGSR